MTPQPPDFNRLLAEGRTYADDRFRAGCVVTVRIAEGADLRLPSGRVIAIEPAPYPPDIADTLAFVQRVPPGTYPVQLIMADFHDPGNPQGNTRFSEVAAARLLIRDEPVERWRLALQDGQDDTQLAADEYYAYAVDGGTGSFASPEVFAAFVDEEEDAAEDLYVDISFGMDQDDTCVYTHGSTGNNLVAFRSGGGDGRYGTWVGYTAGGEVACFLTDFLTLTSDDDEEDDDEDDEDDWHGAGDGDGGGYGIRATDAPAPQPPSPKPAVPSTTPPPTPPLARIAAPMTPSVKAMPTRPGVAGRPMSRGVPAERAKPVSED